MLISLSLSLFLSLFYHLFSLPISLPRFLGLFNFLLKKLSVGQSLDLLVLKELLGRMGGCDTLLDMSADQLEGLAGGKCLKAEVRTFHSYIFMNVCTLNFSNFSYVFSCALSAFTKLMSSLLL